MVGHLLGYRNPPFPANLYYHPAAENRMNLCPPHICLILNVSRVKRTKKSGAYTLEREKVNQDWHL